MKRYVIERNIPGIGSFGAQQLQAASRSSMAAIRQLGFRIQWEHSYIAADKTFCLYLADDEAVIREHARLSGFPANQITEIPKMIDATWADE